MKEKPLTIDEGAQRMAPFGEIAAKLFVVCYQEHLKREQKLQALWDKVRKSCDL